MTDIVDASEILVAGAISGKLRIVRFFRSRHDGYFSARRNVLNRCRLCGRRISNRMSCGRVMSCNQGRSDVKRICLLVGLLLLPTTAHAFHPLPRLHGQVIDHTRNHHKHKRFYSAALCECRDMYVYLPPCYDPTLKYPLMIWLHGIGEDETESVRDLITHIDRAIVAGCLPPMIVAIPDGSRRGHGSLLGQHSFFVNSNMGCFEDYIERDVWDFLMMNYPIRPEREAHVLGGYSAGGFAAYYHGIRYKDRYGVVFGINPPLNLRWLDCHGRYRAPFDPNCWGWRESVRPGHEVIGRFYCLVTFRLGQMIYPLFGRGPDAVIKLSQHNPIEMIDQYQLKDGDLAMFVAYSGRDEFNTMAQVESFLFRARERGIGVQVAYDPNGRHRWSTAERLMPETFNWLAQRLAPYAPK